MRKKTQGQVVECLLGGHKGKLGLVREMYRRVEVEYAGRLRGKKEVVGIEGWLG